MTKLCPLCQHSLEHIIDTRFDPTYECYECPTKAMNKSQIIEYSHYQDKMNGHITAIIYPYKIVTAIAQVKGEEEKYGIYRWGRKAMMTKNALGGTIYTRDWVWLMECPVIPIETEDKLRERIETLVTFS